jgi:hypothetical protein
MIVDANAADLELYDHVVREIYPAQQRAYGTSLANTVATFRDGMQQRYDRRKLALYGLKQRAMLKPTLRLYRGRRTGGVVRALIG